MIHHRRSLCSSSSDQILLEKRDNLPGRFKLRVRTLSCFLLAVLVLLYFRSGVRPFGVSLLMAGYDSQGPHLYQVRHGWMLEVRDSVQCI